MELLVNVLLGLLSVYIVYEYYRIFFEAKEGSITTKLVLGFSLLWQIVSIPSVLGIPTMVRLVLSTICGFVIGICFVGSTVGKVVFAALYHGVWALTEFLVGSFFLMADINITGNELLGATICEIYLLLLVKLLQLFFRHKSIRNFSLKHNGIFMIIPIAFMLFSTFMFLVCAEVGSKGYITLAIGVFLLLMIATMVIFYMYIKLVDGYELKRKNEIYQKELALHTEYIREKEHIIAEFNKTKHDLKNNLIYMQGLIDNKKYGDLEKHIKELSKVTTLEKSKVCNTENTVLDSFINYKYDIAIEKGISFTTQLEIPYDMPIDNGDLCVILGNALDNAIEANDGKDIANPYINLMMRYGEGNLVIIVENSFDGSYERNKDGTFKTLKKEKNNHGIGLGSIQSALTKYKGQMDVAIEDNKFKLSIIMFA